MKESNLLEVLNCRIETSLIIISDAYKIDLDKKEIFVKESKKITSKEDFASILNELEKTYREAEKVYDK